MFKNSVIKIHPYQRSWCFPSISSPGHQYTLHLTHSLLGFQVFYQNLVCLRLRSRCFPCDTTSGASVVRRVLSMTINEPVLLSPWRGDLVPLPEPVTLGMSVQNS